MSENLTTLRGAEKLVLDTLVRTRPGALAEYVIRHCPEALQSALEALGYRVVGEEVEGE